MHIFNDKDPIRLQYIIDRHSEVVRMVNDTDEWFGVYDDVFNQRGRHEDKHDEDDNLNHPCID